MKDPAFLFYFRDFKSSTEKMTNTQRGAYIQLMCMQAENGYISDQDMKKICSIICFDTMQIKLDAETYNLVKSKFSEKIPGSGQFINNRLEDEIKKRAKYCESRRNNKKTEKKETCEKTYDITYEKHMDEHMVNININENINRNNLKGVQGENENLPEKYGTMAPKYNDPAEAGIDPRAGEGPDWNVFCYNHRVNPDDLLDMYESYRYGCKSKDEVRDRKQHLAAFTRYCLTWNRNERNNKYGAKAGAAKKSGSESKVDELIAYLEK